MKSLDKLIVLVFLVSVALFLSRERGEGIGPSGLKVYEGGAVPGGREGIVEIEFTSLPDSETTCEVTVRVRQLWILTRYENASTTTFPPGVSFTNVSIFLPDGRNEVVIDAKC